MPRLKQPPSLPLRPPPTKERQLPVLRREKRKRNRYDMRKLSQFDANRKQYLCFRGQFSSIGPLPEPLCSILSDPQCTAYIERTHLQLEEEHTLIQLSCRRISDNILMPAGLEWSLDWLIKQFKKYGIKTIIEYVSYGFSSRTAFRKAMEAMTIDFTPALISEPSKASDQHPALGDRHMNCDQPNCEPEDILMEESLQIAPHAHQAEATTPAAAFAATIASEPASTAWIEYLLSQPISSSTEPWQEEEQWHSFRGMLCSSLDPAAPSYRPALDLSAH